MMMSDHTVECTDNARRSRSSANKANAQRFFFRRCISGWLAPDTKMKKGPKNEFLEPPHTLLKLLAA